MIQICRKETHFCEMIISEVIIINEFFMRKQTSSCMQISSALKLQEPYQLMYVVIPNYCMKHLYGTKIRSNLLIYSWIRTVHILQ